MIVGRCAAHVLAERGVPAFSVFVHAPMEHRIERIMERHNLDKKSAIKYIRKNDKARANYHMKYAGTKWGLMQNYDMTISSAIGIDKCVDVIATLVRN